MAVGNVSLPIATSFWNSIGHFFDDLASVRPLPLLIALGLWALQLTLRSRAYFNTLRAAYPDRKFEFRRIWGAYVAGFGLNNVIPARGGDIVKLFLVHSSIEGASYPTVASSFIVEGVFDFTIAIPILIYAASQGVLPSMPDIVTMSELNWLVSDGPRLLFIITGFVFVVLLVFALLSVRVKAFWQKARQGISVLFDGRRYFRSVWLVQLSAWAVKAGAFFFMLDAFRIGPNVYNPVNLPTTLHHLLLMLACAAVATAVPFTPGGAGVQQALIVRAFRGSAPASVVAAYSVGQQLAFSAFSFLLGLGAVIFIFGFRSFGEVHRAGKAHREAAGDSG